MYLYENAIIDDLSKLFKNVNVSPVISDSLNESLRRTANNNNDKITLPFVTLSGGSWELLDTNFYNTMHGSVIDSLVNDNIKSSNIIAFKPQYDLYIVAATSRECDMLTREIIFHYTQNPTLNVKIPYNADFEHTFNLYINKTIRKTQTASSYVYRTINIELQGAYLWHINTFKAFDKIEIDVIEKYNNNNNEVI